MLSRTDDERYWVLAIDRVNEPPAFYLYDSPGKKLTLLFTSRPELEGKRLAPMHARDITARDGTTLPSYLSLPPDADPDGDGKPTKALPMVLYVHGGPWARDTFGFNPIHQWLANRGLAVLSVNYRGSTGFGKDFINKANWEFAGAMHQDLVDAVDWAIKQGVAQKDKVRIMGGSYGGYATLVGMTFTPDTFACGVDVVGPSNLVTLIESFPAYWQPFLESSWYKRVGNPKLESERKDLLARSPITKVQDIKRPLLIGQGATDPRVTQKESDQIVAAMKARSIPVTYALYPDEGHGFQNPENRISFNSLTENFFSKCLGSAAQPFGQDLTGSSLQVPDGVEHIPGLKEAWNARNK
ncbi:MAG TPA: S9 family peptidase [Oligoflexus sp.]|nr:S9 family peptidase [Oligoflexus sp.]HET9236654.1 S9 family peptidase [Oligoflexus sp.]